VVLGCWSKTRRFIDTKALLTWAARGVEECVEK
jgi:hypothetical protein